MELRQEKIFEDIDKFNTETETYSRAIFLKHDEYSRLDELLKLYTEILKSATKGIDLQTSKVTNLHYKIGVSAKSIRVLLPYFYASIKGFYDEANIFVRNFVELSLVLIDIGYKVIFPKLI